MIFSRKQSMIRRIALVLTMLTGGLATTAAQATDLWCNTKIGVYGVSNDGLLWIAMDAANSGKWTAVCSLSGTTNNGVTPQACQGMMSTILTAKALGKSVTLHLMGSGNYATCGDMPVSWTSSISSVWTSSE